MTILTGIMVILSMMLVVTTTPKIYGSWLLLEEYAADGDIDSLLDLQARQNAWAMRHLCLALLGVGFVATMTYRPELAGYAQTAGATAAYSVISLLFSFAESLLAQRISGYAAARLQPVKVHKK